MSRRATDAETEDFSAVLHRLFDDSIERTALASTLYEALVSSGKLHAAPTRTLTYRCDDERCTLLDVITTTSSEIIIGFPRYKTSPGHTEATSNDSGRKKNTEDGYRRWKRHAAFGDQVSRPMVSCDHIRGVTLEDDDVQADRTQGHAEVIVRANGSRYAR